MINTIIGGLIALISGIAIGILTPTINSNIKRKELVNQQILKLTSTLYLLKNNLVNYLNSQMFIDTLGECEAGSDEIEKLEKLDKKIIYNLESLYETQQELLLSFENKISEISSIYDELNELEHFIWRQKIDFNINKEIFDQESSNLYSNQLDKMITGKFIPKIESLIKLNCKNLKIKDKKL